MLSNLFRNRQQKYNNSNIKCNISIPKFINSYFLIHPFSTNVPLANKAGSWFLLAKCLKNTCGAPLLKMSLFRRCKHFASKNQLSGFYICGTFAKIRLRPFYHPLYLYLCLHILIPSKNPAGNFMIKVTIETLEQGVEYVQS